MYRVTKILSLLLLSTVLSGCFEEEVFSDVPRIEFQDIRYVDTQSVDSLILSFSFEDEGADIGLNATFDDLLQPYQVYDLIIDANDSAITINQDNLALPLFRAPVLIDQQEGELAYFYFPENKVPFAQEDNRPAYDCDFYEIIDSDTFFIQRNEFHNNFHIEFERKRGSAFAPLDFNQVFNSSDCTLGQFDGRIPYYDPEGKSGNYEYAMISQAFRLAFLDDSIRVRFYVYDRALNKSNEVVSPPFLLKDITN
ncbi:MAG: hypothetical protein Tsb0034_15030 [Ekhidna sp.]